MKSNNLNGQKFFLLTFAAIVATCISTTQSSSSNPRDQDSPEISVNTDYQNPFNEIVIDTNTNPNFIGNCQYKSTVAELCKSPVSTPGNRVGFWSSCGSPYCIMSIPVGQLINLNQKLSQLTIQAFVKGGASMQAGYRLTPAHDPLYLRPYVNSSISNEWTTTIVDLSKILGLTPTSTIIIRMVSLNIALEVDVLDRLVFSTVEAGTTVVPITTTTLGGPQPIEAFTIDISEDLTKVIGTPPTCTTNHYEERFNDLCKFPFTNPGSLGFWSSCADPTCDLSMSIASLETAMGKIPSRVDVLAFVSGSEAQIRVGYRLEPVGTLVTYLNPIIGPTGTWVNTAFDLSRIALTGDSEIVVTLVSPESGAYVDVLDKILFTP